MAILGYSEAFDFIINQIQKDFGHPIVSESLVQDTYYHLFKPSADAKLIDYVTLASYRNMMVFIRGSSYVPPSHEKLRRFGKRDRKSGNQSNSSSLLIRHYSPLY